MKKYTPIQNAFYYSVTFILTCIAITAMIALYEIIEFILG